MAKDANDFLQEMKAAGIAPEAQVQQVAEALNQAPTLIELACQRAGELRGAEHDKAFERCFKLIAKIESKLLVAKYRPALVRGLRVGVREFNDILKGAKGEKEGDGDKPDEIVETFGCWLPNQDDPHTGWLLDYLYDGAANKAWLAYRNPQGEIGKAPHLDINGKRYMPKIDDNIRLGIVMMPSELGPVKTTTELLAIHEDYHRRTFLLDNPLNYKIASFYSLFTWVFDCFNELPYLRARGDKDTGKSAIMLRLGYICYRLAKSTGVSTTASLKYATHTYHSTVFLDEMDVSDQFDERIVMLNIGAMKDQAYIWQMTPVKTADGLTVFEPLVSNVFGPKLITMYDKFSDPATESRCITFSVFEKEIAELRRKKIPRRMTEAIAAEALSIRNMDITWRLMTWQPNLEIPESLEDEHVSTRINQVTLPIKYLVKDDQAALDEVTVVVRAIYEEQVMDRAASFEARILEAIIAVLDDTRFIGLGFVQEANTAEYGLVKYIRYPDLGRVANFLIDEMNTGKVKDAATLASDYEDKDKEEGEEDGPKKGKKKKTSGISSKTIGDVARKDLRLPVQRMGAGYVVILHSSTQPEAAQERMDVLRVKYGLSLLHKPAAAPAVDVGVQVAEDDDFPGISDEDYERYEGMGDD